MIVIKKSKKKKAYPAQVQASIQHALSKQRMGMIQEAEIIYQNVLLKYHEHPDANHLYGVILYGKKNYESAVLHIKLALKINPKNSEYLHNLGIIYKDCENLVEAEKLFNLAIKFNRQYSFAYNSLGSVFLQRGDLVNAIKQFKNSVKINPQYLDAKYNLANAYILSNKFKEAIPEYEALLIYNPGEKEIILKLGDCYTYINETNKAIKLFKSKLNSVFSDDQYLYKIAEIYEIASNLDKALEWIKKAREKNVDNEKYLYLHAVIMRRTGDFEEARLLLEQVHLPVRETALTQKIYFELGRLYDRLGDYDLAFKNYKQGNQAQKNNTDKNHVNKNHFLKHVQHVSDNLSYEWLSSWHECSSFEVKYKLVFMVAFPRSGTTLLDQILDGHSQVKVMEEVSIIGEIIEKIVSKYNDYPNCIARLSCKEIKQYRRYYFEQSAKMVELIPTTTLVDKLPLNIIEIELIKRLFPESKIILSLRHPLDVCLSNFMQHFDLNDAMANFLTLEDTAYAYRQVMELWQKYREVMSLSYKAIRYEDLVENPEAQAKALATFLDLEWEPDMLNHTQHAKTRKIDTPSYQQVTENIYTRSKYRWKNYKTYVNDISFDLKLLIESFGYTEK